MVEYLPVTLVFPKQESVSKLPKLLVPNITASQMQSFWVRLPDWRRLVGVIDPFILISLTRAVSVYSTFRGVPCVLIITLPTDCWAEFQNVYLAYSDWTNKVTNVEILRQILTATSTCKIKFS